MEKVFDQNQEKEKVDIGIRIKAAVSLLNMNVKQTAELTGISYPTIRNWIKGRYYPNGEYLVWLAKQGVNINWVLTGEGEVLLKKEGD